MRLSCRGVVRWAALCMLAAGSGRATAGGAEAPKDAPASPPAAAVAGKSESGLPIPRYVSLKADRVNLRAGPGTDYPTSWVYRKAGLPLEVVSEFEGWRQVRDAEGATGWVMQSLVSGRRTALVAPWSKVKDETFPLLASSEEGAREIAKLQPGVIANVANCSGAWCKVSIGKVEGYVRQDRLWGVYPNEKVD